MKNLRNSVGEYNEVKEAVKERWRQLVGFGSGYFDRFEIECDQVVVWWELPVRQGGGITDEPDRFPIACFECETLEEANAILSEWKNK